MAGDAHRLSERELDRIYSRLIRPDFLDGLERSPRPTAVFIGGQPGAGKAYAAARVRKHLATTVGASVAVSSDDLREYHPHWREAARLDPNAEADTAVDVGRWVTRLTTDAMAAGLNLALVTSMRQHLTVLTLARQLHDAGYQVAAVVLATHRDQSRQASLARYDLARASGLNARFVSAAFHDTAYEQLPQTLRRLEAERAVDRLQVVARDGRQLYANEVDADRWIQPAAAVEVLNDFRERRVTTRELADSALRWQTLAQRLSTDPSVPREVASQAISWRNEAMQQAERDVEAAAMVQWGREAEAFKTMQRHLFVQEFPQHAKAVERFDEAIRYAEKTFGLAADRDRFIAQSRERLAERIAEGRYAGSAKAPTKDPGSRTR